MRALDCVAAVWWKEGRAPDQVGTNSALQYL